MRPVLRISEVYEFVEGKNFLFFQLDIYASHYFDSSIRVYEVLSIAGEPNKSLLVATDVLEVDELKRSGTVRFLFKGKVQKAISNSQVQELNQIQ